MLFVRDRPHVLCPAVGTHRRRVHLVRHVGKLSPLGMFRIGRRHFKTHDNIKDRLVQTANAQLTMSRVPSENKARHCATIPGTQQAKQSTKLLETFDNIIRLNKESTINWLYRIRGYLTCKIARKYQGNDKFLVLGTSLCFALAQRYTIREYAPW